MNKLNNLNLLEEFRVKYVDRARKVIRETAQLAPGVLKEMEKEELLGTQTYPISARAKLEYYALWYRFFFVHGDMNEGLDYALKAKQLFEENP